MVIMDQLYLIPWTLPTLKSTFVTPVSTRQRSNDMCSIAVDLKRGPGQVNFGILHVTKHTLLTSDPELENLHQVCDTRKQSVRVDRDTLSRLLIDHVSMYRLLHAAGKISLPAPAKRERVRAKSA